MSDEGELSCRQCGIGGDKVDRIIAAIFEAEIFQFNVSGIAIVNFYPLSFFWTDEARSVGQDFVYNQSFGDLGRGRAPGAGAEDIAYRVFDVEKVGEGEGSNYEKCAE